jgi:catechol 2,3-dioxygenase-like lactoylglutathione lyase family enzyme
MRGVCLRRWSGAVALVVVLAVPAAPPRLHATSDSASTRSTLLTQGGPPPLPAVLDHVNIAVSDLERAGRTWRALGFVLKKGRPHANSVANLHAKFSDGTEIELITAREPRDSLAAEYIRLAAEGDGGGFAAIRVKHLDAVRDRFERGRHPVVAAGSRGAPALMFPADHPCHPFWFFGGADPWIDAARYFRHANGAARLLAVWVAEDRIDPTMRVMMELTRIAWPPTLGRGHGTLLPLGGGTAVYVRDVAVPVTGRGIVGVTVAVKELNVTRRALRAAGVEAETHEDPRGTSLLVAPGDATGIWLEFLEPSAR